jgi:GNAT superfamily N-acetyltransferase
MACIDKKGKPFDVKKYSPEDFAWLETMYASFYPKGKFQGMPPLKDETGRRWIKGLLENGENFLAWQHGQTVGHAAVLPDFTKADAEYLIFVSHPCRGRGIGSELTRVAVQRVRELHLRSIWLTCAVTNFRAIGLYQKFGFKFAGMGLAGGEHKMVLDL